MAGALRAKMGGAAWLAAWDVLNLGYGGGKAIAGLADGKWESEDAWNLLSLIPFAGPALAGVGRAGRTLGMVRKVQSIAGSADEAAAGARGLSEIIVFLVRRIL